MTEDKQELIGQFQKNSVEMVKVQINEWKARLYIDVRIWALPNPAEPGSEQPTHKGITLSIDLLPKLIEVLNDAQAKVKTRQETGPEPGKKASESPQELKAGQR